jgi:hypothetical protein
MFRSPYHHLQLAQLIIGVLSVGWLLAVVVTVQVGYSRVGRTLPVNMIDQHIRVGHDLDST